MTQAPDVARRRGLWAIAGVLAVVALGLSTAWGRGVGEQWFASLRIAKPQPVGASVSSSSGANASRRLQDIIGSMIADTVRVTLDEPDHPVSSEAEASQLAGFAAQLPRSRKDSPTLVVLGAHAIAITVRRTQLQTILAEAGKSAVALPPSLDGAAVAIRTRRAIRAQYGHCPAPVPNTLQNQVQGPPPPSTDNGDCIILIAGPAIGADVPPGLPMEQLVEIAIELSGMSPDQARSFLTTFDWNSALSLSLPRFIRSSQAAAVSGTPAVLFSTGGRRGPTYALVWARNGLVFALTGYGSSGDAVALANSTN